MSDYKVMIETTPNKVQAQKRFDALRQKQVNCKIVDLHLDNRTYYSVQAGPFTERKDALTQLDAVKHLGIRHAFITRNAI